MVPHLVTREVITMFQSFFQSFVMVFTTITTICSAFNKYASAFEKSGTMVDNYVNDAVKLQKLEHAKRMAELTAKAEEQGVTIEID